MLGIVRWLPVLVTAAALGEETPRQALDRGVALFEQGRTEDAAFALEAARAAPGADPRLRARIWLWLGVVRSALNDSEGAREAFDLSLAEDPNGGPLPASAPPRAVEWFDEARAKHGMSPLRTPAVAPPAVREDGEEAPAQGRARWPVFAAAGATVVLLAAAVVVGVASLGAEDEANEATSVAAADDAHERAAARATAANVLYALAGAGAVVTFVAWTW